MIVYLKMNNQIIASAYTYLHKSCKNNNILYAGKTSEDILNDIVLQTVRHFKNKQMTWDNTFNYMKDTFFLELHFSPKRRNKEKILLLEDCKKTTDFQDFIYEEDD